MTNRIIVIGLGNILCGDEGFGPRAVARLYASYDFPANVEIVDGGTRGQALFDYVARADKLLVYDTVDFDLPIGRLALRDDPPAWLGARKMSIHQNSFCELLALAELKNVSPRECLLIGLQPSTIEFGDKISDLALKRIGPAICLGLKCLAKWDVLPVPSTTRKQLVAAPLMREIMARFR